MYLVLCIWLSIEVCIPENKLLSTIRTISINDCDC